MSNANTSENHACVSEMPGRREANCRGTNDEAEEKHDLCRLLQH